MLLVTRLKVHKMAVEVILGQCLYDLKLIGNEQ
jgi:hypothetical protein